MNNRIRALILGLYLSFAVGISGYLYINPDKIEDEYGDKINDFTNFKYSILISLVIGILIFTFFKFFTKKTEGK